MRGAAVGSAPAITAVLAAPAYALSCNQLYAGTMDWGTSAASTYSRTDSSNASGTINLASTGGTLGLTIASAFAGYTALTTNVPNLTVVNPVGGLGAAGLAVTQVANSALVTNANRNNQTMTFTDQRPVRNLSLSITDIDFNANQYRDAVAITDATFTRAVPTGSTVTGAGTIGTLTDDPFRSTANVNYDIGSDGSGNVVVSMAGPVTTFRLVYWNRLTAPSATNLQQGVFVSSMSLEAYSLGC